MSKQTAIQKAIEQLKEKIKQYDGIDNAATCFNESIDKLTDLLPYEREVIEDAYKKGEFNFGASIFDDGSDCISSSDYFTKTFTENGNY